MVREGAENDLLVRQCTFAYAAAYCHTRDANRRCQFGELTPPICIACMKICCSLHKNALTYEEIIFSTFSNQQVLCICICLISCTESETYAHVDLRDGGPVFRAPLCIFYPGEYRKMKKKVISGIKLNTPISYINLQHPSLVITVPHRNRWKVYKRFLTSY